MLQKILKYFFDTTTDVTFFLYYQIRQTSLKITKINPYLTCVFKYKMCN